MFYLLSYGRYATMYSIVKRKVSVLLSTMLSMVRDQEKQTQLRPDRRTLGMPRNEANEKRAERYRQRKGLAI